MSDQDRFIAIETRIAYQDDLTQTLNDTVVQQERRISVLEERYQVLLERLSTLPPPSGDTDPDEPPPHY